MKRTINAVAFILATTVTFSTFSISAHATVINDVVAATAGAYGRVPVESLPQGPRLYSSQPVFGVMPPPQLPFPPRFRPPMAPVYMWVPDQHRLQWAHYCGQYGACGQPVYFVEDHWYREHCIERGNRGYDRHFMYEQQRIEQDRVARARWEQAHYEREQAERERIAREQAERQYWEHMHGPRIIPAPVAVRPMVPAYPPVYPPGYRPGQPTMRPLAAVTEQSNSR